MQVRMADAVAGPETGVVVAEARFAADHVGEQMMPAPANVEFGLYPGERVVGVVAPIIARHVEARYRRDPAFFEPQHGVVVLAVFLMMAVDWSNVVEVLSQDLKNSSNNDFFC